jgi:GH25 family lysozyme M1 (1,4-beta-N-acetylmuramidase)
MTAIDISRYQGAPNFAQVKTAVSLVIAKQGGADDGLYTDRQWASNLVGIRAAGLALGSYFFNGPGASPVTAADYQWAAIDYRPGDLVVIDVEGSAGIAWSPAQVLAWCQRMLAHGVRAVDLGMYISASPLRSQDWSAVASLGVFLWVASYGSNSGSPGILPTIRWWSAWSLWQYTSNGSVPGIAGRVDMSQIASGFPPAPKPKKELDDMDYKYFQRPDGPGSKTQWMLTGVQFPEGALLTQDITVANGWAPISSNGGAVLGSDRWQPVLDTAKIASDTWKAAVASSGSSSAPPADLSELVQAVTAGNALLSELLAATKVLNPPG